MSKNTTIFLVAIFLLIFGCKQNTVKDIDGNVYQTIKIGKQTWMLENLKVTRYRNGNPIFHVSDAQAWSSATDGAYCNYGNDSGNSVTYGRLYNWYAVNDQRNLAPEGWRIPTPEDISLLTEHLKGDTIAAAKLKDADNNGWLSEDNATTNESGFTALPGGYRFGDDGSFHVLGSNGYWWTTTQSFEMHSWSPRIYEAFADIKRDTLYMKYGLAVRCIKDE